MSNQVKLLSGVVIAIIVIIGSIMTALSILKEEAINNYLTISKLNARAFSKELNQDLNDIEQTIKNISSLFDIYKVDENINNRLTDIIRNYPQIRSINILKEEKIVYSSNEFNLGLYINDSGFFPKPLFDDKVLRISAPWVGRDFITGTLSYSNEEKINLKESFFIPISKRIDTKRGEFNVIVNLNSDYFTNRFLTNLDSNDVIFELIRLDGTLLLSTLTPEHIGKKISDIELLNETIEKSEVTGIETIEGTKYIITYILTDNYPINLSVMLDYNKNLLSWNKKQYNFFIITTSIVILSILIALISFYFYNRKREEESLLQKLQLQDREKFKLLFQDSHFLSAVISKDGKIIDVNNLALKFLDRYKSELKDRYFWDLECWRKEDKSEVRDIFRRFNRRKLETEIVAYDKNKKERIIEFTLSSFQIDGEELFMAVGLDVTVKKEREEILKQAYTVFENTRDGIIITDKNTKLIDVNRAFEKITGYKKKEILNKETKILKSNIHNDEFYKKMWNSINKNGYWEGEIVNINKDNEEFTECLTINTIYDNDKNVLNYIGVFSDITEQKNKERLLREKDNTLFQQSKLAAMGEMIGNIAHQWRQPLSAISSSATGLLLQKELGVSTFEDEKKTLNNINESTQFLSQTIEDFRNFLKVDKELKEFDINDAIEKSLSLSDIKKKTEYINIVLNTDKTIKVVGIENEFIQVIINLINNSKDAFLKFNDKKFIFIDSYIEEDSIYIDVKDNAGGIDEKIIGRVFEPYFTTKHQYQGTGIGLYMSLEIIRNHMNGVLMVENQNFVYENKEYTGACFRIKIPIGQKKENLHID